MLPHSTPKQAVQFTLLIAPYGTSMTVVFLARCGELSGTDGATHLSSLFCSRLPCVRPSRPASGAISVRWLTSHHRFSPHKFIERALPSTEQKLTTRPKR
ncbi:hypothetical protein AERO8C_20657 [Aeromonas veronii]|uniref:Uncharacterized protein n=1 Tax=Aeromonas veronii TaxID=654 RepID=A0A653L2V3_AERVE|nr:hypothetical protein AERO8C_20657 [Aeromonas veronii]